jgi:hypothetical protein
MNVVVFWDTEPNSPCVNRRLGDTHTTCRDRTEADTWNCDLHEDCICGRIRVACFSGTQHGDHSQSSSGCNPNVKIWFYFIVVEVTWRGWDAYIKDVQSRLSLNRCHA